VAASQFEEIDLSPFTGLLHPGTNVLAVHGLNLSAADPDFLILPELRAATLAYDAGMQLYFAQPTPGQPNGWGSSNLGPLIVNATLGIGGAILQAAALGFLGLGATPPAPEWGQMISVASPFLRQNPHMVFFPGMAIMLTVLSFNLLGDGLRDALDPQMRE
jgi:hypothetical protein